MAATTHISWADSTLNFWIGCTKVSPACDHCYAEVWGNRFGVKWGPKEQRRRTAKNFAKAMKLERRIVAEQAAWDALPLANRRGPRPALFCFSNSLSDIFDNEVPIEWLRDAFDIMRAAPHVTFLLLTKRPQNIVRRATEAGGLPPNAAIGCTVVNQKEADRDVPVLLIGGASLKPAFTFISVEPILGPIDIAWAISPNLLEVAAGILKRGHFSPGLETLTRLGWVIVGGESGAYARAALPKWVRPIRDACDGGATPFHFKQWGTFGPYNRGKTECSKMADPECGDMPMQKFGVALSGRMLDGQIHDARPII